MPQLDVSDVLLDPEFIDMSLVCVRQAQTVGNDGLAVNTPTSTPFYGVVTNDTGDLLERRADGERIMASITVHTKFRLTAGKDGLSADIVTWDGDDYTVSAVANWSKYGRGFMMATCDLIPLSGGVGGE